MKRLLFLSTLLATSGLAACAGIFGFDRLEAGSDTPQEAGADATPITDGGADADAFSVPPGCDQLGIPSPPGPASKNQNPDRIWMAFDLFDLGASIDGGAPIIVGYNLDQTCTTSDSTSSCLVPDGGMLDVDLSTLPGLDNAGAKFLSTVGSTSPFNAQSLADALRQGTFGALIGLDLYNGEANDEEVLLNVFPALGVKAGGAPTFTRADRWIRDDEYNKGGGFSQYQATGYVSDGTIVARFPEVTFHVPVGSDGSILKLRLTQSLLTAKIAADADGQGYHLSDGKLAARWALSDMLIALGELDDSNGKAVCESAVLGNYVRGLVCARADIAATPAQDVNAAAERAGAQKIPCNALSAGARFTAYSVGDGDNEGTRPTGTVHSCDAGYAICP